MKEVAAVRFFLIYLGLVGVPLLVLLGVLRLGNRPVAGGFFRLLRCARLSLSTLHAASRGEAQPFQGPSEVKRAAASNPSCATGRESLQVAQLPRDSSQKKTVTP